MPAVKAALGRWRELVDLDKVSAVPLRLVFELGDELTPAYVRDSLAQFGVFHPVLDCQCLDTDRLVLTDQTCRKFLQEITASVDYSGMDTGDFLRSFRPVLASLLLSGMSPLSLSKLFLIFGKEFGVADLTHQLYVDLQAVRLTDYEQVQVFLDPDQAKSYAALQPTASSLPRPSILRLTIGAPIVLDGGKDSYTNWQVLHRHCHDRKTAGDGSLTNRGTHNKSQATEELDELKDSRPVLKTSKGGNELA